jgi:hypothetical protein
MLPFLKYLEINSAVWRHATQLIKSACLSPFAPEKARFTATEKLQTLVPFGV